jgi:hypothetical protein
MEFQEDYTIGPILIVGLLGARPLENMHLKLIPALRILVVCQGR